MDSNRFDLTFGNLYFAAMLRMRTVMMMMLTRMKMMKLWILQRQLKHGPKIQTMNTILPIMTMRVWQRFAH